MNHYSKEAWQDYVNSNLDEEQQENMEVHLCECESCLNVYLQCVDDMQNSIVVPEFDEKLTDSILEATIRKDANEAKGNSTKQSTQPFYLKPAWQYVIAASITIILMGSGMFEHMLAFFGSIETSISSSDKASLSEELMSKTINLINNIQQSK